MTEFNSPRPDQKKCMEKITLVTKPSPDYELIDSGLEEKLERYGEYILTRPDPQALWPKNDEAQWDKAHATYSREGKDGQWKMNKELPKEWQIEIGGLTMLVKPTSFKHTGVFPEQVSNWNWIREQKPATVLNLFGYTGGATIAAAQAGAEVTHVDASKTAVAWAKENAERSGVADKPIRWIIEDVLTYVEREIKRGMRYDLIVMDPPAFGHGPKSELWKFEEHFLKLMELCEQLLSENPVGMLINGYAASYSASAFAYNLEPFLKKWGGKIEYGELAIEEAKGERQLPCGIFARWSR
jgi:23S rRNA (cytosine1962-C5)-methyltransferase